MNIVSMKVVESKCMNYCIFMLGFLTAALPIVCSLLRSGVDCDSAYYLSITERIAEGYSPYESISVGYTPLFFYLASWIKLLFHIPNGCYWPYLLLNYFFEFGVAFFSYEIASQFGSNKKVAIFGGWLCVLMLHWLQGNCVLLEAPSLFFGLASAFSALRMKTNSCWNYLWIGVLSACAFLCKQFGFGFFALDLYIILVINRQTWKECVLFVLGYFMPILFCFAIWKTAFVSLIISGYGTKTAAEAGRDVSVSFLFRKVASSLLYFSYMVCAAVFVGLLCLPKAWREGSFWRLLFGYLGIIGFSLQFVFSGGIHYMMYMVPFACLVITEMMSMKNAKWLQILKILVCLLVVAVTFYKVYYNRVYKLYIKRNDRAAQCALTKNVKQYMKPGETLWVVHGGLYYLYFTADVLPPNLSTIGYSFGPLGLNEEKAFQQAKDADWVIRYSKDYAFESFFTDSLKQMTESYQLESQFEDSAVLLYKNIKYVYPFQ